MYVALLMPPFLKYSYWLRPINSNKVCPRKFYENQKVVAIQTHLRQFTPFQDFNLRKKKEEGRDENSHGDAPILFFLFLSNSNNHHR